ncbi:MAG: DNA polymerase III subunit beta [Candidatus Saccharicenans sp.]
MRFITSKNNIINELSLLQGIVEKRTTMPILSSIMIRATKGTVEMMGTDLEVGLRTKFEADVRTDGRAAVNGRRLFEFIKLLPEDQEIEFIKKDEHLIVRSGESEIKVLTASEEDFPEIQASDFEKGISWNFSDFKEMIDCVLYAITQEQRYYLSGALLSIKNNQLELVSTDGHRLSYTRREFEGLSVDKEVNQIVSKKTLNELKKFENEKVDFDFDDNSLYFRVNNRVLISRIIESKFPNYQAVIPRDNPNILTVDKEALIRAIKRVAILSSEKSRGIKFDLSGDELRLFSSNPEFGEARDKLTVEYRGKDMEIGFNSQYLLDFMETVGCDRVIFEIKDENSAVLIKPESEPRGVYFYVLMPMKI